MVRDILHALLVISLPVVLSIFLALEIGKVREEFYGKMNSIYELIYQNISKFENEISNLYYAINYLNGSYLNDYYKLKNELMQTKDKLAQISKKLLEIESKLEDIENRLYSSNYIVLNPTLEEVKKFLEEDDTDKIPYDNQTFICTDFANRFVSNFLRKGYYACVSILYFEDVAHAIVAINTRDYGLIYVEPQQDKIIFNLKRGMNYCDAVGWYCNYTIKRIIDCFNYGK